MIHLHNFLIVASQVPSILLLVAYAICRDILATSIVNLLHGHIFVYRDNQSNVSLLKESKGCIVEQHP